jgi:hypothetical protein
MPSNNGKKGRRRGALRDSFPPTTAAQPSQPAARKGRRRVVSDETPDSGSPRQPHPVEQEGQSSRQPVISQEAANPVQPPRADYDDDDNVVDYTPLEEESTVELDDDQVSQNFSGPESESDPPYEPPTTTPPLRQPSTRSGRRLRVPTPDLLTKEDVLPRPPTPK